MTDGSSFTPTDRDFASEFDSLPDVMKEAARWIKENGHIPILEASGKDEVAGHCTSATEISKEPSGWMRQRARYSISRPKLFFAVNS